MTYIKVSIRRDCKSPDFTVNDKQLQTAYLVDIFDNIILIKLAMIVTISCRTRL